MFSLSCDRVLEPTQKSKLRKSFKLLKSHACQIATFTLQWHDLEEHLRSIHYQIESKLQQKLATTNEPKNDENLRSKDLILSKNEKSQRETENKDETGTRTREVLVKSGKELILFVKRHLSDHKFLQDFLFKLFNSVDEPGKLVLEALEDFYPQEFSKSYVDTRLRRSRRSCVVLLEEFGRVREIVDGVDAVREEAKRMSAEWRGKMKMDNSLEVLGFLQLLSAFGLVGEFAMDEILNIFDWVSQNGRAPELFRALGFADKASDYVQKLITRNRRLEAVRFLYAFELVNQFPPVPLLKGHAKYAKKVSKKIRQKGNNSLKAQDDASDSEIGALRGIIKLIKNYQLGSEYSPKMLRNQILQIQKQMEDRKANTKTTGSNAMSQQNNRNKRTAADPSSAQQNQQKRNKHTQRVEPNALNTLSTIPLKQPPRHEPEYLVASQGAKYSTRSAGADAPSKSFPYAYVGDVSNTHLQPSPTQVASLLTAAQRSISYIGNYHGSGSTSLPSYLSLAARPYEFSDSATIHPHASTLPRLYESNNIGINDYSGQFGFTTTHTPMANASNTGSNISFPYYHGEVTRTSVYYNRQASSSSAGVVSGFNNTTSGYYDWPMSSGGNYGV